MKDIIITYKNNKKTLQIGTSINGSKKDIADYYLGKWFNLGREGDSLYRAITVQFEDGEIIPYIFTNEELV